MRCVHIDFDTAAGIDAQKADGDQPIQAMQHPSGKLDRNKVNVLCYVFSHLQRSCVLLVFWHKSCYIQISQTLKGIPQAFIGICM